MGRAQVMQAEACGILPDVRMNPILLKPTSDMGSQVIVNGEVVGSMSAAEYFAYKHALIPDILRSFAALSKENDIVVLEGAGSPAEINLKQQDIVNMGNGQNGKGTGAAGRRHRSRRSFCFPLWHCGFARCDERAMVKGFLINKFRGDPEILKPGLAMLEEKTDIPVFGRCALFGFGHR
jgi:adenosylcobyric acid synthase